MNIHAVGRSILGGALLLAAPACGGVTATASATSPEAGNRGDAEPPPPGNRTVDSSTDAPIPVASVASEAGSADRACDPSSLSWSPATLAGLVLWLDSEDLPGGAVSVWRDRSPAHNDAMQPVAIYRPTLVSNALAGFPAVRFDGRQTYLQIADSPSLEWGVGDYVILVVARFSVTLGTVSQMLFQKVTMNAPWDGPSLYVNGFKPTQAPTVTSQNSQYAFATSARADLQDAPHLFGGRRAGRALEVRLDGASQGATTLSRIIDISDPGQPIQIGQNGYDHTSGFEALEGDIAEYLTARGTLSAEDLRAVECHLRLKYGL